MITALIGIQTVCVGVTAYYSYKLTKRVKGSKSKLKLVSKDSNGFKHYRAGGF